MIIFVAIIITIMVAGFRSRIINWKISLFILLAMILLVIPLSQNILLTYQSSLGMLYSMIVYARNLTTQEWRTNFAKAFLYDPNISGARALFCLSFCAVIDPATWRSTVCNYAYERTVTSCIPWHLHHRTAFRPRCRPKCLGVSTYLV